MPTTLQILFVTPEIVPFCKTGGLADVSGALPGELEKLGATVKVVCPYYAQAAAYFKKARKAPAVLDGAARLWLGGKLQEFRVLSSRIPRTGVEVFFIDFPALFGRKELYQEGGKDYHDNFFRFAFFSKVALELAKKLDFRPDIVHVHDWQTALLPVYLKTHYADDPFFSDASSVLTVHNLAYQGLFDAGYLHAADIGSEHFNDGFLEYWGKVNVLKGGIVAADRITTVSPTYAEEVKTEEYGCGMDGILRQYSEKLTGILNGIDYKIWNPETDELIPHKYSRESMRGKTLCKLALQDEMGLDTSEDTFLVGMISRLVDQKGFDLIIDRFEDLMKLDIELALLGTGKPEYEEFFRRMASKFKGRFAAVLSFDDRIAHLIEAGSDAFLMPSKYEPCGLNQLYSLRYGAVPIVRATGGLNDTITNAGKSNIKNGKACGFAFAKYTGGEMLKAVKRSRDMYLDEQELWARLVLNGMSRDYSWGASARKYAALFKTLAEKGR